MYVALRLSMRRTGGCRAQTLRIGLLFARLLYNYSDLSKSHQLSPAPAEACRSVRDLVAPRAPEQGIKSTRLARKRPYTL